MTFGFTRRTGTILTAAVLTLFLTACLLMPGKFAADLDLSRTGNFSFRYNGEIVFLPLTKKPEDSEKFEAKSCFGDEGEERECSASELAVQKSDWEKERAGRERMQAESAKSFLGGIDPSDPEAGRELAEKLSRQAGWNKVESKGNGVFDVEFAITGTLDHDFVFPTIEGFPMANAFVQISKRRDGTVRIDAPGFGQPASPLAMGGMMPFLASEGGMPEGGEIPVTKGRFTLRTNADILANNTDEGPQTDPVGQRLDWDVSSGTPAPPTALLRLSE